MKRRTDKRAKGNPLAACVLDAKRAHQKMKKIELQPERKREGLREVRLSLRRVLVRFRE
jgi:hypothetical protein